jgi:effector-binding domain-containing protein
MAHCHIVPYTADVTVNTAEIRCLRCGRVQLWKRREEAAVVEFTVEEVPTQVVATIRRVLPVADLGKFFEEAFGTVMGALPPAGGSIAGPPFGWYHGRPSDTVDVAAGFPVGGDVHAPDGGVVVQERPGGRAAVGIHVGPYDDLAATYGELEAWMTARSLVPRSDMWEEYLSEPTGDPATWQTRIVTPLA